MDSQEKSLELENEKNAEVTPTQAAADHRRQDSHSKA